MYEPPQFKAKDPAVAARLMREHPFASLVSTDDAGLPYVTHLPLHLEDRAPQGAAEPRWVLLGHVAKPNAHWRHLQARPVAVASFLGPHAYLSPKVYPDLARVPTWNYLAVHCTVRASLVEDPLAKDRLLKKLIGDHEPPYAEQWRNLGEEFAHKMLAGIVGFELEVTDWQCKAKLNQHRPESHAAMRAAYAEGGENGQALLRWLDLLGIGQATG
jgi:transcriptional regulator